MSSGQRVESATQRSLRVKQIVASDSEDDAESIRMTSAQSTDHDDRRRGSPTQSHTDSITSPDTTAKMTGGFDTELQKSNKDSQRFISPPTTPVSHAAVSASPWRYVAMSPRFAFCLIFSMTQFY